MSAIKPPIRIRRGGGSYYIEDAEGQKLCFTYFDHRPQFANSHHWSEDEAREVAQVIARAVTDRLEG